mmetsp:Transcript_25446/g.58629  ORF Transcript_25446/g.58629 Transcript_25446/m.58629 type:complete len:352 (-) Transcript_25446:51-1106(-)
MSTFEEQVRALQGVWQEKTERNWSVVGVEAFLVKKDGTKGKRYTMTEGRDGYAIWGSGKFILDPKFQVGSDTARWYDSRLQKVQFEWYFLRDHPVGSEDSKAEIVPKPRPVPQRPPGLWAKGSHSKGTFGYEAGSWGSSYWAPAKEQTSRKQHTGDADARAWAWGTWSQADSKGDRQSQWGSWHGSTKAKYGGNYDWYLTATSGKDHSSDGYYHAGKKGKTPFLGAGNGADNSWYVWGASGYGNRQGKGKHTQLAGKGAGKARGGRGTRTRSAGGAEEAADDAASDLSPGSPVMSPTVEEAPEQRYDPDRGETATYAEFRHFYGKMQRKQEIDAFWEKCAVVPEDYSIERV